MARLFSPRSALIISVFLFLSASRARPALDPERKVVLQTVQSVLDAWREADGPKLDRVLHPDFREVTYHLRDGKWELGIEPRDRLIGRMAGLKKGAWDDRLIDPQVILDGPIAVVWSRYRFVVNYVDDGVAHAPAHCGVATFQLYRTDSGWKIVNFADTHADCN